mmetsp:Transcript_1276/g.1719  ORF Transcript_1276/g.1719 Transcript_1276/m.1719 type:complete len:108 (+) Transcript_1276:767-1090(+)
MSLCSDATMLANDANRRFCEQLASWVFQETGVLRATNLRHNEKGVPCLQEHCPNPENYKIEDHVEFYIDMEIKIEGKWQPYEASDIQLQFIMLEPYYSVTLEREPGT